MTDLVRSGIGADLAADLATDLASLLYGDPSLLLAVSNFSAANFFATQVAGGEVGVASGFGGAVFFRLDALTTASRRLLASLDALTGWMMMIESGANLRLYAKTGVGSAQVGAPTISLVASDVGKLFLFLARHDGANVESFTRRASGGTAAIASYAPSSGLGMRVGLGNTGTEPADGVSYLASMTFRGSPSVADIQEYFDRTRLFRELPDKLLGAVVTHYHSVRRAFSAGVVPANGSAAPAALADNITGAAADGLAKQGPIDETGVRVVAIDPSVDGRVTYGVLGFSTADSLVSVNSALRAPAGDFHFAYFGPLGSLAAVSQSLVGSTDVGNNGWQLLFNSSRQLVFNCTTRGQIASAVSLFTSVQPRLVVASREGAAGKVWLDGALVASGPITAGALSAPTGPLRFGARNDAAQPLLYGELYGASGGLQALTDGEVAQIWADVQRTGRIQILAGKTSVIHDVTADVLANGGPDNGAPALVLDRIGSDHLTRIGADYALSGTRGLRLIGTSSALQGGDSAVNGIQAAASALTVSLLISPLAGVGAVREVLACKLGARAWDFRRQPNADLLSVAFATATTSVISNAVALSAPDYGTFKHLAFTYDGATLRFYIDGVLVAGGTACTGDASSVAGAMQIGYQGGGFPCNNDSVFFGIGGGPFVATQGELAAQVVASKAAGRLVPIPGKPDSRRYNFDEDAVQQQTSLPTKCVDRMGNNDPLTRIGSPLQVARRVERLWSYETKPIVSGFRTVSSAGYNSPTPGPSGLVGSAAGFWFADLFIALGQTINSGKRLAATTGVTVGAGGGYKMITLGANTSLHFQVFDGTNVARLSPAATIGAADLGKIQLAVGVFTGNAVRLYFRRVQVGTETVCNGYSPNLAPDGYLKWHKEDGGGIANEIATLATGGGLGVPSLAQIQALFDAVMVAEDLVPIPGMTDGLWSISRLRPGAPPPVVPNSIPGGVPMLAQNVLDTALVTMNGRAFGW